MLTAKPKIIQPNFSLSTPPASEPVTISDFEAQKKLTLDGSEYDKVTGFLVAAREACEAFTRRAFIAQTWVASFDAMNGVSGNDFWMLDGVNCQTVLMIPRVIELPRPPLVSVDSIEYYSDGSDTPTTFPSSLYQVSMIGNRGRVMLRTGSVWPSGLRPMDSIVITYTCGYGTANEVPQSIKEAIVELAAHWYENREGQPAPNAGGAILSLGANHAYWPVNVRAKLSQYLVPRI